MRNRAIPDTTALTTAAPSHTSLTPLSPTHAHTHFRKRFDCLYMSFRGDTKWLLDDDDTVKRSGCGLLSPKNLRRGLVACYRRQIQSRRGGGGGGGGGASSSSGDGEELCGNKYEYAEAKPDLRESFKGAQHFPLPAHVQPAVAPILVSVPVPARERAQAQARPPPQVARDLFMVLAAVPVLDFGVAAMETPSMDWPVSMPCAVPQAPIRPVKKVSGVCPVTHRHAHAQSRNTRHNCPNHCRA